MNPEFVKRDGELAGKDIIAAFVSGYLFDVVATMFGVGLPLRGLLMSAAALIVMLWLTDGYVLRLFPETEPDSGEGEF